MRMIFPRIVFLSRSRGKMIRGAVMGRNVRINSYCLIEDSIIMDRAEVKRGCRIRKTIIDKNVIIPPGVEIGYDPTKDRERYFVSEDGIVVIPRGQPKTSPARPLPS